MHMHAYIYTKVFSSITCNIKVLTCDCTWSLYL